MKIILLKDIPKIGKKGEIKDFKEGYAQNVFLSKGLAELATPKAMARLEEDKRNIEIKKKQELEIFNNLISSINNQVIKIKAKSNEKGHLFKAINQNDISKAIKESVGVLVDEKDIIIDNIKSTGKYNVKIKRGDKSGNCQVVIE
jgi:large subunit ribosomal protein L9